MQVWHFGACNVMHLSGQIYSSCLEHCIKETLRAKGFDVPVAKLKIFFIFCLCL